MDKYFNIIKDDSKYLKQTLKNQKEFALSYEKKVNTIDKYYLNL